VTPIGKIYYYIIIKYLFTIPSKIIADLNKIFLLKKYSMTHKKGELMPRLTLYIYIYSMTKQKVYIYYSITQKKE